MLHEDDPIRGPGFRHESRLPVYFLMSKKAIKRPRTDDLFSDKDVVFMIPMTTKEAEKWLPSILDLLETLVET